MTGKIIIVGGGLSGLTTALELAKRGIDFELFEARPRFGGRILTLGSVKTPARFDLGPSWFWPGQRNIEGLIGELGLDPYVFEQESTGDAVYEQLDSEQQRGVPGISMAGSYRLDGGLDTMIEALVNKIDQLGFRDRLHSSSAVSKIGLISSGLTVTQQQRHFPCDSVVLALPARVALENITFSPALSADRITELQGVATWMSGHAKVVIEYSLPFWRSLGFSGDVISQIGPMSEIHDASSRNGGLRQGELNQEVLVQGAFALFGFINLAPATRSKRINQLPDLILQQLGRIFGHDALTPLNIHIQDWAQEPLTATKRDQSIPNHHPLNTWSTAVEPNWNNALIWSGSEAAMGQSNGYLEGAVLASRKSIEQLSTGTLWDW